MKILVHDFAGHPFQAELSRALARRGHLVDHAYCGGVTTGRGDLERRAEDPDSLIFTDVSPATFERYAPLGRLRSEVRYGRGLAAHVRATRPDAVLSANTPLLSQALLWRAARQVDARRIYWVQDFLGRGTRAVLTGRSSLAGATIGAGMERLETDLLRRSDAAVVIADDFVEELTRRGVSTPATVIENWAPLDEITPRPKDNPWSRRHGLHGRPVALYSGTLGLKHDPVHLVHLAEEMRATDGALVVITEGTGRAVLEEERQRRGLDGTLYLFDYVDYTCLPDVFGAADVCLVLLEADAGTFSVPSKVLSYLAAGRPIVAAVPAENLAARTIARSGAGPVTPPGDHRAFSAAVLRVLADHEHRRALANAARDHAEAAFAIEAITDRVLGTLMTHSDVPASPLSPSPLPSSPSSGATCP